MTRGGPREGSGRPVLDASGKARMISLKLPPVLIDAIRENAGKMGISQTQFIAMAVRAYLVKIEVPSRASPRPEPGPDAPPTTQEAAHVQPA